MGCEMLDGRGAAGLQRRDSWSGIGSGYGSVADWGGRRWERTSGKGPCRWDMGGDFSAWRRDLPWCPAPHPLQAVPTMGCQGRGTGAARAVAGLACTHPPPSMPAVAGSSPEMSGQAARRGLTRLRQSSQVHHRLKQDFWLLCSLPASDTVTVTVTVTCLPGSAGGRESWSGAGRCWAGSDGLQRGS